MSSSLSDTLPTGVQRAGRVAHGQLDAASGLAPPCELSEPGSDALHLVSNNDASMLTGHEKEATSHHSVSAYAA